MRINYLWSALFSACIAFTGCSDDVLEEPKVVPWQEGNDIIFGARAGFQNDSKESRTQYTGKSYTDGGKNYEQVVWTVGDNPDEISVLCPEAYVSGGGEFADYKAIEHQSGQGENKADYATFVPVKSNHALQWGNLDHEHHFYAVYPSVNQMTDPNNPERQGVKIKKTDSGIIIEGMVPVKQKPYKFTQNERGIYVGQPMMRNAIMTATSTFNPRTEDAINLSFKSFVTAIELDFVNNNTNTQPKTIMSVMIRSKKYNLAGKFTANLSRNKDDGYPETTFTSQEAIHQVIIPTTTLEGGVEKGLKLKEGERLKLTAFIMPVDNLDDLEIVVKGLRGEKSHPLESGKGGFKAHLKHYVKNISMPRAFNSSRWMSLIDDNVYLSQLSIPGTGNSYSFKTTTDVYQNTQQLNIRQQWDLGIRCFELSCEHKNKGGSPDPNFNLGDMPLQVNKTVVEGTSVKQAIQDIYDMVRDNYRTNEQGNQEETKVKNPTEIAMVIMNYQPRETRNPEAFLQQFTNYYNSIKSSVETKLFKPNLTLGEARGKILFILRPSSDGEDDIEHLDLSSVPQECLVVNGWGSLHDKWKQRGYITLTGEKVFNCAVDNYADQVDNTVEQLYLQKESKNGNKAPGNFQEPRRSTPISYGDVSLYGDYTYKTNHNFDAWAQEWPRVVREEKGIYHMTEEYKKNTRNTIFLWTHWFESYNEKLEAAKATFKRAVANKANTTAVYFNSLCGYFVVENYATPDYRHKWSDGTESHKWGEAKGHIRDFSDKINLDFYKFMQGEWDKSISGPMGVIMMNHVGITDNGQDVEETFLMPDLVISNNFTFPLLKSDKAPKPDPVPDPLPEGSGSSYGDGGSLWY